MRGADLGHATTILAWYVPMQGAILSQGMPRRCAVRSLGIKLLGPMQCGTERGSSGTELGYGGTELGWSSGPELGSRV
eukprot:2451396-Rhodomonas_salina.1